MTDTPSIETVLKAWVQYRQHTHGSNMRTKDAEKEFYAFINKVLEQGWDEGVTVQIRRLISEYPDSEKFQMTANPYREQENND